MTIRIEQIDIVRMAQAVSAGPELDVIAIAQPAGEVAGADDIVNAADDVAVMMQGGSGSTFSYRDTAANRSECINDWNCLSSALKCISTCELSESTVSASMAAFSTGEALIFL